MRRHAMRALERNDASFAFDKNLKKNFERLAVGLRASSLTVTFLGDSIAPRAADVGLATIAQVLGAFNIDNGAARTTLSRLAAENWVCREKVGRHAFYALTPDARAEFQNASQHIYRSAAPQNCCWTLFLTKTLSAEKQKRVRNALERRCAGRIDSHTFVLPSETALSLPHETQILTAQTLSDEQSKAFVKTYFKLSALEADYRRFSRNFTKLAAMSDLAKIHGLEALALRTLIIHHWRRLALRDPLLPSSYLASDWPGFEARAVASRFWNALFDQSEQWLENHASCAYGRLPEREQDAPRF